MTETDHFESGFATLSTDSIDFESSSPYQVSGVAIPVNTIVNGGQNVDHFFPPETLEDAGKLLEGKPIVKNFHDIEGQATADDVIGEVKNAGFQKGVGLVFEGEITDKSIAQKVAQGYLDVSPSPARSLGAFDDSMGAQKVDRLVDFRDLAVVANGQPGAKIKPGGNPAIEALARDALSRGFEFDVLQSDSQTVAGVSFIGTKTGELDESDIPSEGFESHYLYPGDTKSESSYPVVDGEGYLRKGNVESAHQLGARGGVDESEFATRVKELAQQFDSVPEWATDDSAESDTQSDDGTQEDSAPSSAATTESDTMSENDLSPEEQAVLAAADDVEDPTEVLSNYAAAEQPQIVEADVLESKDEQISELAEVFRDALSERTGLSEATVEAMPVDALCNEFRNEDGDLEADTLAQNPETKTTSGESETPDEPKRLSREERDELDALETRINLLEGRAGEEHLDTLKSEAADLAGVEEYGDIEMEVL